MTLPHADSRPEHYDKSFLSVPEQIRKLVDEKGLIIPSTDYAAGLLRTIGYYRLSGYWHFYRDPGNTSTMRPGTSMKDVHALYLFDQQLKQRVFAGTGIVEIALRFQLGHQLGKTDTFAHLDPDHLSEDWTRSRSSGHPTLSRVEWSDSEHAKFSRRVHESEKQSAELFVTHFRNKYQKPYLPVWVATELFSFGMLTSLYNGAKQEDQHRIASAMGFVDEMERPRSGDLNTVLNLLRHVRNICAHHARLWNRGIDVTIPNLEAIPELAHLISYKDGAQPRVYDALAALAYLIDQVDPGNSWRMETVQYVAEALSSLKIPHSHIGFPEDWAKLPLWQVSYEPSHSLLREKLKLLESVPHVPMDVAGGWFRLHNDKGDSNSYSARKRRVRYARGKGALVGLRVNDQVQVPCFQVDRDAQDLFTSVTAANLLFFRESGLSPADDASHLSALRWWVSPLPEFQGLSPLDLNKTGRLNSDAHEACAKAARKFQPARDDGLTPPRQ